jgi:hypothetical protein
MRPPPEGAAKVDTAGRSPGSRVKAFPRPSRSGLAPVAGGGLLAAYSCGGSRGFGRSPHRVPFCVPPHAGTDDGRTIAAFPRFARAQVSERIDKEAGGLLKWPRSTVSQMRANRERGTGSPPKSAAAPATVSGEPEPNSHWEGPGKAAKAKTREPGDLPSILVARRAGCLGAVGSLAGSPAKGPVRRHCTLKVAANHPGSDVRGDSHRHR